MLQVKRLELFAVVELNRVGVMLDGAIDGDTLGVELVELSDGVSVVTVSLLSNISSERIGFEVIKVSGGKAGEMLGGTL